MGRAKVKSELIAKEGARNITFQRRKKGLKKKMYEFTTLCGVDAGLIILGPNQGNGMVEPETWPEKREDVLNIINRFRQISTDGKGKRHIRIPDLLKDQTKKVQSKLDKLRQCEEKGNYPTWDDRITNFSKDQLNNLVALLDSKLEHVKLMIDLKEFSDMNTMDDMQMQMEMLHYLQMEQDPSGAHQLPGSPSPSTDSQKLQEMEMLFIERTTATESPHMTRMMNGMDNIGNCYDACSSIVPYHPLTIVGSTHGEIYYNPLLPTFHDKTLVNNTGGGSLPCYFYPHMQSVMHPYFAP